MKLFGAKYSKQVTDIDGRWCWERGCPKFTLYVIAENLEKAKTKVDKIIEAKHVKGDTTSLEEKYLLTSELIEIDYVDFFSGEGYAITKHGLTNDIK